MLVGADHFYPSFFWFGVKLIIFIISAVGYFFFFLFSNTVLHNTRFWWSRSFGEAPAVLWCTSFKLYRWWWPPKRAFWNFRRCESGLGYVFFYQFAFDQSKYLCILLFYYLNRNVLLAYTLGWIKFLMLLLPWRRFWLASLI